MYSSSSRALFLCVVASLGLYACSSTSSSTCSPSSAVATTSITVRDYSFNPSCVRVPAGSTVTWTNVGMASHTVTSDSGAPVAFDSGALGDGGTFSFTFTSPGTVNYYCIPHQSLGMVGTVFVQ
jgi:plastocyanin